MLPVGISYKFSFDGELIHLGAEDLGELIRISGVLLCINIGFLDQFVPFLDVVAIVPFWDTLVLVSFGVFDLGAVAIWYHGGCCGCFWLLV